MAIVFDCPHCGTNYRLKDEVGGKTATCKNPNCRKVIPIPMPNGPVRTAMPADLDAFAAAAFAEDPLAAKAVEATIEVTCARCDHKWMVEASKEGKNVLCPECRHPNRVPLRKKQEKADWRTGGGGPSGARRETGMDREGAFASAHAGGISDDTARKIVSERAEEVEPEERRKKLLKRGAITVLVLAVVGSGAYFAFKTRKESKAEARIEDAVKEIKDPQDGAKDPKFHALVQRAMAEYRIRTATKEEEATAAFKDLQLAKNTAARPPESAIDRNAILSEIAVTLAGLLGTGQQVEDGKRMKAQALVTEFRTLLQKIPASEADLLADTFRALTRKFAEQQHPALAEEIARQLPNPSELIGQVGLELLRMDKDKYRGEVENLLTKATNNDAASIQAVRLALGKAVQPKKGPDPGKKAGPDTARVPAHAEAEAYALRGMFSEARQTALGTPRAEDKARALTAAALAVIDSNPAEAATMLEAAANLAAKDARGQVSPWVGIRLCRLLGKAGRFDLAESVAGSLSDEQAKSWARLEALRGRLAQAKSQKGEDGWLDTVGDPTKHAAAAKAREELARHNAAVGAGGEYQVTVKSWPKGTVRPFGLAGLVLGGLDSDGK